MPNWPRVPLHFLLLPRFRATCALMFWGESRKAVSSGSWREGAPSITGPICMGFPCLLPTTETPGRSFRKRFGAGQKVQRIGGNSRCWGEWLKVLSWGDTGGWGVGVCEIWVLELKGTCKWVRIKDFIVQRAAVAAEMASRSVRSCTGLRRKADAPPSRARSRAFGKS